MGTDPPLRLMKRDKTLQEKGPPGKKRCGYTRHPKTSDLGGSAVKEVRTEGTTRRKSAIGEPLLSRIHICGPFRKRRRKA